jgi:tRNA threonylcarbamoyladenosine biosynthesis protein TsaE
MPILDVNTLECFSRSPEQTRRLGIRLGALLQVGDIVCLHGQLGAGKTTLVQGIAHGWGSLDPVTSPTFVLVNEYCRPSDNYRVYHLDAYRIETNLEAEQLDLDEMLSGGALVVEWPERIEAALPVERLWANLTYVEDEQRDFCFTAKGKRAESLLKSFRKASFGVS